jgi:hypothetical protein
MEGRFILLSLVVCLLLAAAGCSDNEPLTVPTPPSGTDVTLEITSLPQVRYDAPTGKTSVVVQFIARDEDGYALGADDVVVEMLVNDLPVDNESILQEDAEELAASIHFGLVLDASYSMLLHDPAAFAPMLQAASEAIEEGYTIFAGRAGTFTWDLSWFAESLFHPDVNGRPWQPADLLAIPEPSAGTSTKLLAATADEAARMTLAHDTLANGPNDHHVMIVFSDGADNYSWFDNSAYQSQGVTASGAAFAISGYPPTDLAAAAAAIAAHPDLTVHVIGLGSEVRDTELQAIADAGGGRYYKNPSSAEIDTVFDLVTREFATIQTHGATIPLPPADYTFRLRVEPDGRGSGDEYGFTFRAGGEGAGVLR